MPLEALYGRRGPKERGGCGGGRERGGGGEGVKNESKQGGRGGWRFWGGAFELLRTHVVARTSLCCGKFIIKLSLARSRSLSLSQDLGVRISLTLESKTLSTAVRKVRASSIGNS
jgi:hypothetical protein